MMKKYSIALGALIISSIALAAIYQYNRHDALGMVQISQPQGVSQYFSIQGNSVVDGAFFVSGGEKIVVDLFGEDVTLTLVSPSGQIYNLSEFSDYQKATISEEEAIGLPVIPLLPGTHQIGNLPISELGEWKYTIRNAQAIENLAALELVITGQGKLSATSFTQSSNGKLQINQNDQAVIIAKVYKGDVLSTDKMSAKTRVFFGDHEVQSLELNDEGSNGDEVANDGLYSAYAPTNEVGTYYTLTEIYNSSGRKIIKTQHVYDVFPNLGTLNGVRDNGPVDKNGDGLNDLFILGVSVNTERPGKYTAAIALKGSNGQMLFTSGDADLDSGPSIIPVNVYFSDIKQLIGVDGPYEILDVGAAHIETNTSLGVIPNAGMTQSYQLDRVSREPIIVEGYAGDTGVDSNGNGQFDSLQANINVNVLNPGPYTWTASLVDSNDNFIDTYAGSGNLQKGDNKLLLEFDGTVIGQTRVNGPYRINAITIYPNFGGRGLLSKASFQTGAYQYVQFEGAILNSLSLITFVKKLKMSGNSVGNELLRGLLLFNLREIERHLISNHLNLARLQLDVFMSTVKNERGKRIATADADLMLASVKVLYKDLLNLRS